MHIHTQERK